MNGRTYLLSLLATAGLLTSAYADTIRVDPVSGDDANDGLAWTADGTGTGPKQTIQAAIDAAETSGGGDVWLKQGIYNVSTVQDFSGREDIAVLMKTGVNLRGGFEGDEASEDERPPADPSLTVIDASAADAGAPADHVIVWLGVNDTVLERVTITGGVGGPNSGSNSNGAGLHMAQAGSDHIIQDCLIIGNRFDPDMGQRGAGGYFIGSSPTVRRTQVSGNETSNFGGGFFFAGFAGTPAIIEDCIFSGNAADRGGAINVNTSTGSARVTRTLIVGNDGGTYGGGAYVSAPGALILSNSIIAGGRALVGGGIFVGSSAVVELTNCTVADNSGDGARFNPLGANPATSVPTTIFRNTIFLRNSSKAIEEGNSDYDITEISNCLFFANTQDIGDEGNSAVNGAAAINALTDTISANNIDGDPLLPFTNLGTFESTSYNEPFLTLTDDDASFSSDELAGALIRPSSNRSPILPVHSNSGTDITFIVSPTVADQIQTGSLEYQSVSYDIPEGSAARDAGADFTVAAPEIATDFDGRMRPSGPGYDIGAYEFLVPYMAPADLLLVR